MASEASPGEPRPTIEEALADRASESDSAFAANAERALRELSRIDHAIYAAIASTPSPTIDRSIRGVSNAANRSVLWIAAAAVLALFGGRRGRRAAMAGLVSIGVSSGMVNLGLKRIAVRARPDREGAGVIMDRRVEMPSSTSFPSGHSASGFAFATAVGRAIPWLALPLRLMAALVAYSRVHTGVHYPGDAVVGSLVGGATGLVVGDLLERRARS